MQYFTISRFYFVFGFISGVIGSTLSLCIRLQLMFPGNTFIVKDLYNSVFTLHGVMMLYFTVMPVLFGGFGYLLVPLMARIKNYNISSLAMYSIILLCISVLLVLISFFIGNIGIGWTMMPPLSIIDPAVSIDMFLFGVLFFALSFILQSSDFILLVAENKQVDWKQLPIFAWSIFIAASIGIIAFPVLFSVVTMLLLDRNLDTGIFLYSSDPLLYKHLFWFFGHPEVYIVILPCFGIITHIISIFSNKKIYGYETIVISMLSIAVLGLIVWAHHMFASGLSTFSLMFFTLTSILVAIPSGLEIFNWIMTIWGGRVVLATPMLFALGFIILITIGGSTGIVLSHVVINHKFHGSYFIIAHFHYILSLGSVYAIMAGFYYWSSLFIGQKYNELLGKLHFWTFFIANNITFFPQHFLYKMPRHVYTYSVELADLNFISSIGAILGLVSMLIFCINFIYVIYRSKSGVLSKSPWEFDIGREWNIYYNRLK